jgi:hypothetical protein
VPVLGVVFAFAYPDDAGDLIAWAEGCPLTRNGEPLPPSDLAAQTLDSPGAVVIAPANADANPAAYSRAVRPARYVSVPSIAYRMARVAAGEGVAAFGVQKPGHRLIAGWDYAGGHALLRGAGGTLLGENGSEIVYANDGRSEAVGCFGGAPSAAAELARRDWSALFGVPTEPPPAPPFALVKSCLGRSVSDPGRLARAQGCLLGQVAGDSLGGLVEFRTVESIRSSYRDGCRDLRDGGTWTLLAGQPTDDSELALMLGRTVAHLGRYDAGAVLDAYVR